MLNRQVYPMIQDYGIRNTRLNALWGWTGTHRRLTEYIRPMEIALGLSMEHHWYIEEWKTNE